MSAEPGRRSCISPAQAREAVRRKLVLHQRAWALGLADAQVSIPLKPPTEAAASAETQAVLDWVQSWETAAAGLPDGAQLTWVERQWRSWGRQRLPGHLIFTAPEAVAAFAGRSREFMGLCAAAAALQQWAGDAVEPSVLRPVLGAVAALDTAEMQRLLAVLDWLRAHPRSGRFARELPIIGVDSKWLETHRGIVTPLVLAATGERSLGLRRAEPRVRIRDLAAAPAAAPAGQEPVAAPAQPGGAGTPAGQGPAAAHWPPAASGISDAELPASEAAALGAAPELVIVTENLATFLALPADGRWGQALAVFNPGYSASVAARLPWLAGARVLYWGDLDTHGFAILNRFRTHCRHAQSVLMDAQTLADFADLTVAEPRPARISPEHLEALTDAERGVVADLLHSGCPRLEQERIAWPYVLDRLDAVVSAAASSTG